MEVWNSPRHAQYGLQRKAAIIHPRISNKQNLLSEGQQHYLRHIPTRNKGVPQGSILSVTLFLIKINSISKCLSVGTEGSVFVDDFQMLYRSKHLRTVERQLQHSLNKLDSWANTNGFTFFGTKTVCIHFSRQRKKQETPSLKLGDHKIPVVTEHKFLGVTFDNKLSFIPHLKELRQRCNKGLNLLKVVAHTDWGGDRDTLLTLYRSIIRSRIDYGLVAYGSAWKTYL